MSLITYYCSVGIIDKLVPLNQQIERTLTSLYLVLGKHHIRDNEVPIDLLGTGVLWLVAIYDEKDKTPITKIRLATIKQQDQQMVMPFKNYIACYIHRNSQPISIDQSNSMNSFDYDLQMYLDYEVEPNMALILCYQSMWDDIPIKLKRNYNQMILYWKQTGVLTLIILEQSPFLIEYTPYLLDRYPLQNIPNRPLQDMIPIFCFPQGIQIIQSNQIPMYQTYSFVLSSESGIKTYCYCLQFYEEASTEIKDSIWSLKNPQQYILCPKCICLVSQYQFTEQIIKILEHIYQLYLNQRNDDTQSIVIEQYIANLLQQLVVPLDFNQNKLIFSYIQNNQQMDVSFMLGHQYPVVTSMCIETLFNTLDLIKILELYLCLLLERRIQLISDKLWLPGHTIEALQSLLYPFEFIKSAFPILPNQLIYLLDIPEPYIIGYRRNKHTVQPFPNSDTVHVYLDSNIVELISPLPDLQQRKLIKLRQRLKQFALVYSPHSDRHQLSQSDINKIRDAFFRFNMSLLKGYTMYYKQGRFQLREFQEFKCKQLKCREFVKQLCGTSIMNYFLNRRQERLDDPQQQYLDVCMTQKQKHEVIQTQSANSYYQITDQQLINRSPLHYKVFPLMSPLQHIHKGSKLERVRYMLQCMYEIWFKLFIVSIRINRNDEEYIRIVEFGILVVEEMLDKQVNVSQWVFRILMEACGYYKYDLQLQALNIIHLMKERKIDIGPHTYHAYSKQGSHKQDIGIHHSVSDNVDNIVVKFNNQCMCGRQVQVEEVLEYFPQSYFESRILCICGKQYQPKMQLTLSDTIEYDMINPLVLCQQLDQAINTYAPSYLLSSEFKQDNNTLYGNILMYCRLVKLPLFFIFNPELMDEGKSKLEQHINRIQRRKKIPQEEQITQKMQSIQELVDNTSSSGSYNSQELLGQEIKRYFQHYLRDIVQIQQPPQTNMIKVEQNQL